ncbi:MAG TPA: hypothetical protein VLU24_11430 [Mycobacterium sp.]|nr:hypothetical protein [Mycobacterium sp.]
MIKLLRTRWLGATCVLVVATAGLMACAASERTRPLNIGPVAGGPETIESVRRQLQGRWRLVSFETFPASGPAVALKATGELTYDEYGNMTVRGALPGDSPGAPASLLRYSGRAVIDVTNHRLVLQAVQGQGGDVLPDAVLPDQARYYEFEPGLLKLTVKDSSGRPTATITWKRAQ